MSKTFKEELEELLTDLGDSYFEWLYKNNNAIDLSKGPDLADTHDTILSLIKKHQPERMKEPVTTVEYNKDGSIKHIDEIDDLLRPGYNQALADSDKAYGLEDVK